MPIQSQNLCFKESMNFDFNLDNIKITPTSREQLKAFEEYSYDELWDIYKDSDVSTKTRPIDILKYIFERQKALAEKWVYEKAKRHRDLFLSPNPLKRSIAFSIPFGGTATVPSLLVPGALKDWPDIEFTYSMSADLLIDKNTVLHSWSLEDWREYKLLLVEHLDDSNDAANNLAEHLIEQLRELFVQSKACSDAIKAGGAGILPYFWDGRRSCKPITE